MKSLIRHIPHNSESIPGQYRHQFVLTDTELEHELLRMTDRYTAELFGGDGGVDLVFPVSRLLVDVERFEDDAKEVMAARGMGVLYESTHARTPLRRELTPEEREELLTRFYRPHHVLLDRHVDTALEMSGQALIIDCHSFPSRRLPYEIAEDDVRPEICIGTDASHTPESLRDTASAGFAEAGFSVAIDTPFAGAITPMKHYGKDERVKALMIEVRRDLYMDEETGEKNPQFDSIRSTIQGVMGRLKREADELAS